ncbi:MAG: hypothetical protein QNJ45_02415 [Ardenticatenaceae bacterium]|nr:hypothetical protein [Ardenticatenaceae bacterium]
MQKKIYLFSFREIPVSFHISLIPALVILAILIGWVWYPSTFMTLTLGKQFLLMGSGLLVFLFSVFLFEAGRLAILKMDRGFISEIVLFPGSARLGLSDSKQGNEDGANQTLRANSAGVILVLLVAAIFGGLSFLPSAGEIQRIAMQEAAFVMAIMGFGRLIGIFALDRSNFVYAFVRRLTGQPRRADQIWRASGDVLLTLLMFGFVWQLLSTNWLIAFLIFILAWGLREASTLPQLEPQQ